MVAAAAAAAGGFWAVPMRPCVPSEPSDLIGVSDQSLEERFCWFPLQFRLFTLINVLDWTFPKTFRRKKMNEFLVIIESDARG